MPFWEISNFVRSCPSVVWTNFGFKYGCAVRDWYWNILDLGWGLEGTFLPQDARNDALSESQATGGLLSTQTNLGQLCH